MRDRIVENEYKCKNPRLYVVLILLRSPVLLIELLKFGADPIDRLSPVPHCFNESLIFTSAEVILRISGLKDTSIIQV
jgi:hypothetical protein